MASPNIKIKRSNVAGKVPHYPTTLDVGEFAINTADGKVFIAAGVGIGTTVREVGISTTQILASGIGTFKSLVVTDHSIVGISTGSGKVETAIDGGNQWHHVAFLDKQTGYQKLKSNGLTYNPSSGKLYAGIGSFGTLTTKGNVQFGDLTSSGSRVTFYGDNFDARWDQANSRLEIHDNAKLAFGDAQDFSVYHDGTNNEIKSANGKVVITTTSGNSDIEITPHGSGNVKLDSLSWPNSDGSANQSLITDGSGTLSWSTIAGGTNTYTTKQTTTATQGQTAITVSANYTSGFVDVYLNGVRLISGTDYTETNTTTITLAEGATLGDEIETVAWKTLGDVVNIGTVNVIDNLSITGVTTGTGGFVGALTGNVTGNCSGVAAEATALQNSRYFSITGEVTAAVQSFDGTGNTTLSAIVADDVVDAANLKVSNSTSASNGQALVKRSGNTGGMTWESISGGNLSVDSNDNVFGGDGAGINLYTGDDNVLLGHDAGRYITTGYENVCIGFRAGKEINTTRRNVCVGAEAGRDFTAGDSTFIGWYAGQNAASNGNTCIGHMTGVEANGNDTAVGYSCGPTGSYSGDTNVCYGFAAGNGLRQSATRNTIIGPGAGRNASSGQVNIEGSHNIIIGDEASLSSTTVSNECVIGAIDGQSKAITKFRIPGINFVLKDNGGTPTEGHVLTVDSNGEASFAAASGGGGGGSTDILEVMLFA